MLFVVGPNNYQKEVVCAQINMVHLALHWLIARYSWDFLEITPQLISKRDQLLAQPWVRLVVICVMRSKQSDVHLPYFVKPN